MPDDLVTFLAREHDRTHPGGETAGCPSDEFWAQLADGLISADERDGLVAHISRCVKCRKRAAGILAEMDVAKLTLPPAKGVVSWPWILRLHPTRCAMAAAVLLAVGAGLYFGLGRRVPIDYGVDGSGFLPADASLTELGFDLRGRATRDESKPLIGEAAYRTAADKLRKHLEQPSPPPAALALATRAALSAGFVDDAAVYAAKWVQAAPDDPAARNALGLAEFQHDRFAEALAAFERAAELAPHRAACHLNAAMAAQQISDGGRTATHLRRFLQLAPGGPRAAEVRQWLDRLERK